MANTYSLVLNSGSSQYAYINDASQTGLDLSGDFTFEAYVNPESAPGSYTIISKEDGYDLVNGKLIKFGDAKTQEGERMKRL